MLSRRNLFLSSLAAGSGLTVGTAAAQAATKERTDAAETHDVVILGAGVGGLVCAIEAKAQGLETVVLEKMECPSGNSLYASGGIAACETEQQKAEGHDEPRGAFRADMMKISSNRADPLLVDTYVAHIAEDIEWLKSLGVKFARISRKPWPINWRMHNVEGDGLTGGARLVRTLETVSRARNIPLHFNTKGMTLLTDAAGRVSGVRCLTDRGWKSFFAKKGVVVATGGFSANREMLCRYMGGALSRLVLRGSPYVNGENVKLTEPFGAMLVHMDSFHCGPIVEETHVNPNYIIDAGQGIEIDVRGHRVIDEVGTYTQKSTAAATLTPENLMYHLIDSHWARAEKAYQSFTHMHTYVAKADSIGELAEQLKIERSVLEKLVAEYNERLKAGTLKEMTPPCSLPEPKPLDKAPFYAFPFQGGITATFGGPKINVKGQVMSYERRPIKGLYAVGNAAGGLFYGNYIGGSQLGAATVFGRLAARTMAADKTQALLD